MKVVRRFLLHPLQVELKRISQPEPVQTGPDMLKVRLVVVLASGYGATACRSQTLTSSPPPLSRFLLSIREIPGPAEIVD
ncbi:hypothetical protein J6590_026313 [Homalodisca vitripennis]|nr:hypothetical protein J6590_026313 [Homalodisca vitripennis]